MSSDQQCPSTERNSKNGPKPGKHPLALSHLHLSPVSERKQHVSFSRWPSNASILLLQWSRKSNQTARLCAILKGIFFISKKTEKRTIWILVSTPALLADAVIKTGSFRTLGVGPRTSRGHQIRRSTWAHKCHVDANECGCVCIDENWIILDNFLRDTTVIPALGIVLKTQFNRSQLYHQPSRLPYLQQKSNDEKTFIQNIWASCFNILYIILQTKCFVASYNGANGTDAANWPCKNLNIRDLFGSPIYPILRQPEHILNNYGFLCIIYPSNTNST